MIKRISQICVSVIITILLLLLSIYCFPKSWLRLFESFGDFGQSIAYYFYRVFLWKFYPKPSIVNYSNVFEISGYLPDSKIKFEAFFTEFFRLFVDKEHFSLWAESLEDKLVVLADISTLILHLLNLQPLIIQNLKSHQNQLQLFNNSLFPFLSTPILLYVHLLVHTYTNKDYSLPHPSYL